MTTIINYIDTSVIHSDLNRILKAMINSGNELQQQCAINILIDIKYLLISNDYYETLSEKNKNIIDFINSLEKQFYIKCKKRSLKYATVIASNIYRKYLQPGGISTVKKRFDDTRVFDEEFIKTRGWVGYKDQRFSPIIWVTPYFDLTDVFMFCDDKKLNKSNFIFDYIGVLTNSNFKNYLTTFDNITTKAMVISYSDEINVDLFHPNCTIPYGWSDDCSNNIFISFGKPMDEYGRSFNNLTIGSAKERIHKNHFHIDEKYELNELPDSLVFNNENTYNRTLLLKEAENRLI
jgi:hypothetical protein